MRECLNEKEGKDSVQKLQVLSIDFPANSDNYGCPLPCQRHSYSFTLTTLHKNSLLFEVPQNFTEEDVYILTFFYKTLLVEKQVETLVYDLGGFLAAAGGNMGLCLGLSCLSILFTFTQWAKSLLRWIHHETKQILTTDNPKLINLFLIFKCIFIFMSFFFKICSSTNIFFYFAYFIRIILNGKKH